MRKAGARRQSQRTRPRDLEARLARDADLGAPVDGRERGLLRGVGRAGDAVAGKAVEAAALVAALGEDDAGGIFPAVVLVAEAEVDCHVARGALEAGGALRERRDGRGLGLGRGAARDGRGVELVDKGGVGGDEVKGRVGGVDPEEAARAALGRGGLLAGEVELRGRRGGGRRRERARSAAGGSAVQEEEEAQREE